MHELSIAMNIVEIAEETLAQHGGERVRSVHLQVGPLCGVAKEALLFSFGLACEGTAAEGASLVIAEGEGGDLDIIQVEITP
jgi:hydrogenase nickel incorporation protein HypA/HybF